MAKKIYEPFKNSNNENLLGSRRTTQMALTGINCKT